MLTGLGTFSDKTSAIIRSWALVCMCMCVRALHGIRYIYICISFRFAHSVQCARNLLSIPIVFIPPRTSFVASRLPSISPDTFNQVPLVPSIHTLFRSLSLSSRLSCVRVYDTTPILLYLRITCLVSISVSNDISQDEKRAFFSHSFRIAPSKKIIINAWRLIDINIQNARMDFRTLQCSFLFSFSPLFLPAFFSPINASCTYMQLWDLREI